MLLLAYHFPFTPQHTILIFLPIVYILVRFIHASNGKIGNCIRATCVVLKFLLVTLSELCEKLHNFQLFPAGFQFCEDGDYFDVDTLFRSTFGGNRIFYWSFINEETPRWKNSSDYSYNYERNWRYRVEEDYDSSSEFDSDHSESDFASDRLALGLSASSPLKLEDVKHAWVLTRLVAQLHISQLLYQACALKWYPDRHQGSSKAVAEEKFKPCSAAYQSICGKLAAT
ncbi:hypothetical protein DKX38_010161 [Salix brachista]|uniref:Uncharacterized protein n=1 Tax=Salix brachista TaxID=2182728 RepID=A0A5N5MCF5_9ROSI|nr:hypothetical protein DKX38_010161 [Salix brachista]